MRARLLAVSDLGITLESNPGSLTFDRLRAYREADVTTLQARRLAQAACLGGD